MIKKVLGYIGYGIAWGWCWLVALLIVSDLAGADALFSSITQRFTLHALGAMAVGIGCGSSAIVYTFDQLRLWQQSLIHFGAGMAALFPVGFGLGWMPTSSAGIIVGCVLQSILTFFLIWFGFYLYFKNEAKKINARLKQQDAEGES
jgi:uncharacterized membrane protein YciS (DUF1049 family)